MTTLIEGRVHKLIYLIVISHLHEAIHDINRYGEDHGRDVFCRYTVQSLKIAKLKTLKIQYKPSLVNTHVVLQDYLISPQLHGEVIY